MKENPIISVIIPTYKSDQSLTRAVNSVLGQTYQNIELIIVDDNDGENEFRKNTQNLLREFIVSDALTYIKHDRNKGLPAARNSGIRISKGEFIAFLDQDDEWLSNKIERQLELFKKLDESYGIVGCYWKIIDEFDNTESIRTLKYRGDLSKVLGLNHFSPPSMIMVKRLYLEKVNLFDENLNWREDIDLYFRCSFECKFDFVEEVLVNYYKHPGSMSTNFEKKLFAVKQFLEKHESKLKINKIPWSEINEHLAELYAVNGDKRKAVKHFLVSIFNRPFRLGHYGKLMYAILLGKTQYKNVRNFK